MTRNTHFLIDLLNTLDKFDFFIILQAIEAFVSAAKTNKDC
jgi:hypothetical protein